jgi:hypothetical protein
MPSSNPSTEGLDNRNSNMTMLNGHDAISEFSVATHCSLLTAAIALMFLFLGCAIQSSVTADIETFSMPYRYTGLGVGAGVVKDVILLPEGSEADVASRAIVMALQDLEASIIKPDLPAGEWLPEKQQWLSDRVPVENALISDHNLVHPDMILPPRHYEIQYSGQYLVDRRQLVFKISAQLFERALATDWREYNRRYSGRFFVKPLGQLIQNKLRTIAEEFAL